MEFKREMCDMVTMSHTCSIQSSDDTVVMERKQNECYCSFSLPSPPLSLPLSVSTSLPLSLFCQSQCVSHVPELIWNRIKLLGINCSMPCFLVRKITYCFQGKIYFCVDESEFWKKPHTNLDNEMAVN